MPDRLEDALAFASKLSVGYEDQRSRKSDRTKAKVYGLRPAKPETSHCVICELEAKLVADHDHGTGYYRDWICGPCNAGLGMFYDRPAVLRRAARYIERHRRENAALTIEAHTKPSMRKMG